MLPTFFKNHKQKQIKNPYWAFRAFVKRKVEILQKKKFNNFHIPAWTFLLWKVSLSLPQEFFFSPSSDMDDLHDFPQFCNDVEVEEKWPCRIIKRAKKMLSGIFKSQQQRKSPSDFSFYTFNDTFLVIAFRMHGMDILRKST